MVTAHQVRKPATLALEPLEQRLVLDAGPLLLSEFMAANDATLADEDGDDSDWIEIHNPSGGPVDLQGWSLTSDRRELAEWTFSDGTLGPGESMVVFASGKDRQGSGPRGEFHTAFRLDADGDYLALVAPDGVTIVSEFGPGGTEYPPQREDLSYGLGNTEPLVLVQSGTHVDVLVPGSANQLPPDWNAPAYTPDANWIAGTTGVGFEEIGSGPPPLGYWSFDDFGDSARALDFSGNHHHGAIDGASYTADGTGHSGQGGDRALNFGAASNAANVSIADAATGAFDSATVNDAITISLWIYGDASQPANGSVFWGGSQVGGGGVRTVNAHIPWSDSTIYWDTGGTAFGVHRMAKYEADVSHFRGQWNHYAFVKDGDSKEIWQNGTLFHSSTNTADLDVIRDFLIGAGLRRAWSYGGWIDDFAVWDVALTGDQVAALWQGVSPLALSGLSPWFETDVGDAMFGKNASAFLRIPFQLDGPAEFDAMLLRMQYDDGFVAYLNGQEVARRNAPNPTQWNSAALADRRLDDALVAEEIDLGRYADLLQTGHNLLAAQGLNHATDGNEFLVSPELIVAQTRPNRYLLPPTPGTFNAAGFADFVADTSFSVDRGFFNAPFDVEIATATPDAEIRYTLDGSQPTATTGTAYTGPIRIDTTTTLRATALKQDWQPSNVDTQTYLFLDDVITQPAQPAGMPDTWNNGPGLRAAMPALVDYEMDRNVVDAAPFTDAAGVQFDMKDALRSVATMSLVMDLDDLFDLDRGIYANAQQEGRPWERPASLEYIDPSTGKQFQLNCGVRMHGGWNRFPEMLKKSFRIYFRDDYGPAALEFPLFPDSPVERFEKLVLRSGNGQAWPSPWRSDARLSIVQYLRDQFLRDAQRDMGQLTSHGNFVHLYVNGLYWGLYNPCERPDADFAESHLGGDRDEYDVVRWHRGRGIIQIDGKLDAWNAMMGLARGGLSSDDAFQQIRQYLDVESFIDYMIVNLFTANFDWPDSNAYALHRRGGDGKFRFVSWDAEESLFNLGDDRTGVNHYNTAGELYAALRANAEFRLAFADRVQKHFFNDGALTPASNEARWMQRASQIDRAIVAESARWGDLLRQQPYTRNVEWLAEQNRLRYQYFTSATGSNRSQVVLGQFRSAGLYPAVAAPAFNQHGGDVPEDFPLVIGNPGGQGEVYYTLDGNDPRLAGGDVQGTLYTGPVTVDRSAVVKARVLSGSRWSALSEAEFRVEGVPVGSDLVITELNYNPPDPSPAERAMGFADNDEFEFVELKNVGSRTLDLTGASLTNGVRFDFSFTAHSSQILITEAGTGTADYVEVQNVSGQPIDTSGWFVVVNNADDTAHPPDVNAWHSTVWSLPASVDSGEILYRIDVDDGSGNLWGENIFWRTGGPGWVMIVDGEGHVADFLVWGYTAAEIDSLQLEVGGFQLAAEGAWHGAAVLPAGQTDASLQRQGTADNHDASDWARVSPPSPGLPNADLTTPFGERFTLRPGEFAVLVRNADAFYARYGAQVEVAGRYEGRLRNEGERITLADRHGRTILDFVYQDDRDTWPGRADGKGASLELIDPTAVPAVEPQRFAYLGDGGHWRSSGEYGGSPGSPGAGPIDDVVVNEVLSNTRWPMLDAIELHNTTDAQINVAGWYLSDSWGWGGGATDGNYKKFRIPDDTVIPPGGYIVFDERHFNPSGGADPQLHPNDFALDGDQGDDVWLMEADAAGKLVRFVDHVEFQAAAQRESFGRWPNAVGRIYPLESLTLAEVNSGPRVGPLVLSELHYDPLPADRDDDLEFVEVYNPTHRTIDLTEWRLRGGIDYDFPAGGQLAPYGTLVVVPFELTDPGKLAAFHQAYWPGGPLPDDLLLLGGYSGQLDDDGERVQLQRPGAEVEGIVPRLLEDEVRYYDAAPWPTGAAGGGDSLTRLATGAWGHAYQSWEARPPTPGVVHFLVPEAEVVGRHLFYNDSAFDGDDPAANPRDNDAIALDKQALLPGGTASFVNYSSFTRGINGVMVDLLGLPDWNVLDPAEFSFRVGNNDDPTTWDPAPDPIGVWLRRGEGIGESDRVTIVWQSGAIHKQWLQVVLAATENNALDADDVFYFGNAIGETGDSANDAKVTPADMLGARDNQRNFLDPAPIDFNFDFNRDTRVNTIDMLIARDNQTHFLNALRLITVPSGKGAPKDAGGLHQEPAHDAVLRQAAGSPGRRNAPLGKLDWLHEFEPMTGGRQDSAPHGPSSQPLDKLLAVD